MGLKNIRLFQIINRDAKVTWGQIILNRFLNLHSRCNYHYYKVLVYWLLIELKLQLKKMPSICFFQSWKIY